MPDVGARILVESTSGLADRHSETQTGKGTLVALSTTIAVSSTAAENLRQSKLLGPYTEPYRLRVAYKPHNGSIATQKEQPSAVSQVGKTLHAQLRVGHLQ